MSDLPSVLRVSSNLPGLWQDGSRGSASADGAGLGSALNAEGDVAVVAFDVAQDAGGNSEDPAGVAGHLSRLRAMTFPLGD